MTAPDCSRASPDISDIVARRRGLLPPEEQMILLAARNGNKAAAQVLANVYLASILAIARRYLGYGLELETMMIIGEHAFLSALLIYDDESEDDFTLFALNQVANAIEHTLPWRENYVAAD